ncbi:MAG: AAA family ATPase, partial [Lachnoclostridium sp.]|nr:AAA family ATPase [Lachnoclostridium sp.]
MDKKLPIGIENFEEMQTEGFYYIDKTGLIKELLHSWGKVNLFTRPRRFGKSLNMNMLKSFFEIGCDPELFVGLEIAKEADLCKEYMGKFPVISISLKSVSGDDFEMARALMCTLVGEEALRFQFLLDSIKLSDSEKERYHKLITIGKSDQGNFVMSDDVLMASLRVLSGLLRKHYDQKVIILIDEYDVPLAKAFDKDYYDQMITLIRNMFEQALKTNDSMYFSVLTGCLRISKESIFTGLNNPKVLSITDVKFDEYFGFTDQEVRGLLEYYDLTEFYNIIKEWYDGYRFGNVDVYCPWDVICYCDKLRGNLRAQPEKYWLNTSGNDVVRRFIEMAKTGTTKSEIEQLIEGNPVTKIVRQELTYRELYDSVENVWSVLFTTGYLTQRGEPDGEKLHLVIPNAEIRHIFTSQITEWFLRTARQNGAALDAFCEAFKTGDADAVQKQFRAYLKRTISIRDTFVPIEKK